MTVAAEERVREAFEKAAGRDRRIDVKAFCGLVGLPERQGRRALSWFDRDASGRVDLDELLVTLHDLESADARTRAAFAFHLYDHDGSGAITRTELAALIQEGLDHCDLEFSQTEVDAMVAAMLRAADRDLNQRIDAGEFQRLVDAHPAWKDHVLITPAEWLAPRPRRRRRIDLAPLKEDRRVQVLLGLWLAANVLVMAIALDRWSQAPPAVKVARAFGATLNLNGALLLVPMMRNLITVLRRTRMSRVVPFDGATAYHRVLGQAMFVAAVVHTAAHLYNYNATIGISTGLLDTRWGLTGLIAMVLFVAIWLTAMNRVRGGRHFDLFWFFHSFYLAWFILLLFHGREFWMWAAVPVLGFLVDRYLARAARRYNTRIKDAQLLPGRVLALTLERPPGFRFVAGDYLYLKVAAICRFEWHPFTISSAPERDDAVTLHIRSAGDWTSSLHEAFQVQLRMIAEGHLRPGALGLDVVIEGPHSAPNSDILDSEVAVLVAGGIGATPASAVLESIHRRHQKGEAAGNLRHVHFHWVSRGQRSFDWLTEKLGHIERENDGFLDLQIHRTGGDAPGRTRSGAVFLGMDLLHKSTARDTVTGLSVPTRHGRPDWQGILGDIKDRHGGAQIGVFFCGPPGLGSSLRAACQKMAIPFRQEHF